MDAASYHAILTRERQAVLSKLGVKVDALAQSGRVGEEDQAQISYDEFVSLRLNYLDYAKLRQVNEALRLLEGGQYGICQECERPIPARRLQVLPWAKYCVRCQEQISQQEPQLDQDRQSQPTFL